MFIQLLFLLSFFHEIAYGRHNVTIDDQNRLITYSPAASWTLSAPNSLDAGGAHTLTVDNTATANFTFTGVAIYFMSPLWPYVVNTAVSLDSAPLVLIDLVDHSRPDAGMGPETVQSRVVWGEAGLGNEQHTLVISVGANQPYAIIDTLIYTALDPEDLTTTTSTSTTTSNSTSLTATITSEPTSDTFGAPSPTRVLPIALGTVLGVLGLLIVVLAIWFFRRRQRRPVSEAWTVAGHSYPGSPQMTSAMSSPRGTVRLTSDDSAYANNPAYYPPADGWGFPQYGNTYNSSIPVPLAGASLAAQPRSSNNSGPQGYNFWRGPTSNATSPQSPRRSAATAYQPSRLSTITETSTPQAGGGSSLANSPASQQTDIYYDAEGGSDRRSSLPSVSDNQSRASPYLSQQPHLRRDPRDVAARSPLGAASPRGVVDGPPNRYRPPAYTPDP